MVREPIVAGQFYADDKEELNKQIEQSFLSRFGPGSLPGKRNPKQNIAALISPHAGYMFSGPCAALGYKLIAESKIPDLFILLGTNHTGIGLTSTMLDDWETPLGIVKTDKEFAKALIKNSIVENNNLSHLQEHSIEVQLPFLQFACKDNLNRLKFVPITISQDYAYDELAKGIQKTIQETKKNVCVIASSDFTHYGLNYGYMPFTKEAKENLHNLDREAIKHICNCDSRSFLNYINKTGATICGKAPISVLIDYCRLLNIKGKLLGYYTSGDIIGDYRNAVGYACIVF